MLRQRRVPFLLVSMRRRPAPSALRASTGNARATLIATTTVVPAAIPSRAMAVLSMFAFTDGSRSGRARLLRGVHRAANKDVGDEACDVGFVAYYCFGQQPAYSKYNSEEHIDGNVIEYLRVTVETSDTGSITGGSISRAALQAQRPTRGITTAATPGPARTTTTVTPRGCHGMMARSPGRVQIEVPGAKGTYMYSFPAEGEGIHWRQGQARRTCTRHGQCVAAGRGWMPRVF